MNKYKYNAQELASQRDFRNYQDYVWDVYLDEFDSQKEFEAYLNILGFSKDLIKFNIEDYQAIMFDSQRKIIYPVIA